MVVTDFALRHRTTTFVLVFLIVIIGMVSYLMMPREATPDIKIPTVMVIVPYPGVSPEDIESLVTSHLEAELEDLRDLDQITSTSAEGMSGVFVSFMPDTDITDASQRVRDRVNRARPKLPQDVMEPVIKEITSSDWPILMINISGEATGEQSLIRLKRVGEELKKEIETFPGVLEVEVTGGLEREIRVEINPHLLTANKLSLTDVINALAMENINIPGGPVEEGDIRYTLRIPEEITDPAQLSEMVISTKFGHPIRVREVGEVVDGFKERTTMSRYRQREGVSLTVKKQSGANIIELVEGIKEYVAGQAHMFPAGTKVVYLNDFSKHIQDMVRDLENNILTALVLVMAVLFLFIGGRNAMFVALAVPLSMLVSFTVLSAMGITLNMVVLFSLILALGMLVDNAIVIVENIYRHGQMGEGLMDAALSGTKEVGWAVITSTLTTVSVFIPLMSWPGVMGEFMSYLPLTLIITLTSSLFVALVINPVIASAFMKPASEQKKKPGRFDRMKNLFVTGYTGVLGWSLRNRTVVAALTLMVFAASGFAFYHLNSGVEFFPVTAPDRGKVAIRAAEGTAIAATDSVTRQVETYLEEVDNAKHYVADVGTGGGSRMIGSSGDGTPYLSTVSIDFQERLDWTEHPNQTIENLRQFVATVAGATIRLEKDRMGPPTGAPVNIEIAGTDFDTLAEVADIVQEKIKDVKGLTDLRDDFSEGRPELQLRFDRVLSNQLILHGLRVVAGTVRTAVYGTKATTYRLGEEEFDVTVRLQDRFRKNREDVLNLTVAGKEGRFIPLSQVVELEGHVGATSIRHIDRKRVITVSGDAEGRSGAEILKEVKEILAEYSPRGATLSYTGENKEMAKARVFLAKALVIGLFLIAMVLLTQFNSVGQAGIILLSVALSMVGVMWGLVFNRMPFSVMMTGVGIISLAGVVVNNAIVLIDFINKLRARGVELTQAVIEAGAVRLRPVLLTAGTTILGLVPMAQGFDVDFRQLTIQRGTGSMQFWGPMAVAVIYGLMFATVLTLVVVPVSYHIVESAKERAGAWFDRYAWVRRVLVFGGLILGAVVAYGMIAGITGMNG